MDRAAFSLLENYMASCMEDSAHDREHIYRVLYNALEIAGAEEQVDYDVLICACLLHDIGRKEQFENPALCHAEVGGKKAYRFLLEHAFSECFAEKVRACIQSHRYRKKIPRRALRQKFCLTLTSLTHAGPLALPVL